MKTDLRKCILEQVSVKPEILDEFLKQFREETLSAGEYMVEARRICRKLAFINKGILRIYKARM